ncbi:hypothetical protein F5146DRAFT_896220, partial [Armillaria mellea]
HDRVTVAKTIVAGEADRKLLISKRYAGVAISASKVPGTRVVTAHDCFSVEWGISSNNAQVLCMGMGIELSRQ